ncbi:MAG: hypothetical protein AB7U45_13800 [Desulfamplus sp.]
MVILPKVKMMERTKEIFGYYGIPVCANYLNISPSYLRAVLNAQQRPSSSLLARIRELEKELAVKRKTELKSFDITLESDLKAVSMSDLKAVTL